MRYLLLDGANHAEAFATDKGICFICRMLRSDQRPFLEHQVISLARLQAPNALSEKHTSQGCDSPLHCSRRR